MACASGAYHTITLSNSGVLYSFGRNNYRQLGFRHDNDVKIASPIPYLPQIKQVSCGANFTVCVDREGLVWSVGENNKGQLGIGNIRYPQFESNFFNVEDIPPVVSVSCGSEHTLIITNDSNLWSCGNNKYGQLCLGTVINQPKFIQTIFSNISKVSLGGYHSLFQNKKGEIFACGFNKNGECGLGHFNHPQITPSFIPNLPSNIVQFICGFQHNLFLDLEGNVFSVGCNKFSQLGLGHNFNQNILNQIPNIPPVQSISCVGINSYLIDFKGNVWSFGDNQYGQLGHGDTVNRNIPTKIESLKDIQQLSHGCCGFQFLAKDSQNNIFAMGNNYYRQLGTGNIGSISIPKQIKSQYSPILINITKLSPHMPIWGRDEMKINQWKRMCTESTMDWSEEEMEKLQMIQSKMKQVKLKLEESNNDKIIQEFPQNSFETWNEVHLFLNGKLRQINSKVKQKHEIQLCSQKNVQIYEQEIIDIKNSLKEMGKKIQQLQERKKEIEENLLPKAKQSQSSFEKKFLDIENNQKILQEMCSDVSIFCKNEKEMNEEICKLFSSKKFTEFDCSEMSKVLWKMDLTKYQPLFEQLPINGEFAAMMINDWTVWDQLGVRYRDYCFMIFHFEMMNTPGYSKTLLPDYDFDCCVCSHATPEKTIHLLNEYEIPLDTDFILKNNYCAPILIVPAFINILLPDALSPNGKKILKEITAWQKIHKHHLKTIYQINLFNYFSHFQI